MIKTTRPLVSVVIPVFNGSEYLREAVRLVMASSYRKFEVLLIDDGSTDTSKKICQELESKYKRVKFYSFKKNNGLGRVLNYALKKARGKYIARLNQDDLMSNNRLKRQVEFLEKHPNVVVVGTWVKEIDDRGRVRVNKFLKTDEQIRKMWLKLTPCADPAVCFRKKAAIDAGGYNQDFWPADDLHMWYRLGKKGEIANLQEALTTIRVHQGAASMRYHKKHMITTFQVHRWAHEFVAEASLVTQLYWLGQLIAGLVFPAKFNWWVYRGIKKAVLWNT